MNNVPVSLNAYYKTFNNFREEGFMLTIYKPTTDNELLIWACESRNSDKIMIIIGNSGCSDNNAMFNDDAYKTARYFNRDDYDSAVKYVYNIIKKQFNNEFSEISNTKFKMNKSLSFIKGIETDANKYDYEDFYDIATFEDLNENYFCDLIIMDGKLGLRYSKYCDECREELENLFFEEWHPDLTSSSTLMLGMQSKLNDFIDKELDYEVSITL